MTYDSLAWFAGTFGLFWMIGFFLIVAIWTFWPSRRERYRRAAHSVLQKDEREEGP